jgi:hypothetical protein
MLLVGHFAMLSGRFRVALGEYLRAYASCRNEPQISLFIGISLLSILTSLSLSLSLSLSCSGSLSLSLSLSLSCSGSLYCSR